jgi:HPt (histidine-containing phosphotransfer) domain-containing protein
VKGAAATLGAIDLSAAAASLEAAIKTGAGDTAIDASVTSLMESYARLAAALEQRILSEDPT